MLKKRKMSKIARKNKQLQNIRRMRDLELLHERYKYEVKLKEQAMGNEYSYFQNNLKSAARETMKEILETTLIAIVLKLLKR